jgi:membrane protease YdiL (CAAX protease family)
MESQLRAPRKLLLWAVIFEGGLGLAALGLGWWLDRSPAAMIRWTAADFGLGSAAALPMLAGLLVLMKRPIRPLARLVGAVDEFLVPLFRGCRLVDLAVISALAGVAEEMLFRGVIQEAIAGRLDGPLGVAVALTLTSLLFGLAHAITPSYAVVAGLIGLYLGGLWIATGNLLVPITAHAVYDFLALVYLVKVRGERQREHDPASEPEE